MISLRNIDIIKQNRLLFTDFSWQIHERENWVISGANGSGKTMLLEILAGMILPVNGSVEYSFVKSDGWEERYAERQKHITYVPAHALQSFLNDGQEAYYQQRYYSMGDEQIISVRMLLGDDAINLSALDLPPSLSVDHLLDISVSRLSNGQLKKLLLLKKFLKGIPKLLLMDYPFEGLDHESREDLCLFIDFISRAHDVRVVIVDQHHHLPACINRKLVLSAFKILSSESFNPSTDEVVREIIHAKPIFKGDEIIRMEHVQLKYGEKTLFQDFNWRVQKGERWALVGRNGTGKTTLFSMIFADHPQAYAQKIYLFGKRRGSGESIWDIKRRINYLGPEQLSYLNPRAIAGTGLNYLQQVNQFSAKAFEDLICFFDAADCMAKPVRIFSSGELQLLVILSCFLSEKELLLLDEPFQFLDDVRKKRLTLYITELLRPETTMILITHYEADIRQWTHLRMKL